MSAKRKKKHYNTKDPTESPAEENFVYETDTDESLVLSPKPRTKQKLDQFGLPDGYEPDVIPATNQDHPLIPQEDSCNTSSNYSSVIPANQEMFMKDANTSSWACSSNAMNSTGEPSSQDLNLHLTSSNNNNHQTNSLNSTSKHLSLQQTSSRSSVTDKRIDANFL